jgi:metal-responsive CopG/Arc/MetJ family transcriptional regulator
MDRPPLFIIRVHTSLTAHALNRMDKIVGEKGRSAFIRKAVDQMLDALEAGEQMKAKKAKAGE